MLKYNLMLSLAVVLTSLSFSSNANASQDLYRIKAFKRQELCFDVANNVIANGTLVQISSCKELGNSAQTWTRGERMPDHECADGEGSCLYQIKLAANSNFCLDYQYSTQAPANGAKLQIWQCKDSKNGDAVYWGIPLGFGAQAFRMVPGIPRVGIFGLSPSISTSAGEGELIRMRDFASDDTVNNYYRYWTTDDF
jgi:hypothetical protein